MLDSQEVAVKGHMLRILGRLKAKEVVNKIRMLQEDGAEVTVYENGLPVITDIGTLAREAIQLIEKEGE